MRAQRRGSGTKPATNKISGRQRKAERKRRRASSVIVSSPSVFSLIENPDEMLTFFDAAERALHDGKNVEIDLAGVTRLSPEAPAVLLSRIADQRFTHNMRVSGNLPVEDGPRQMILDSGFFDNDAVHLSIPRPKAIGQGRIFSGRSTKVKADKGFRIANQALSLVPANIGQRDGIEISIQEAMNNTVEHAGKNEPWFLSVYCDPRERSAYFTLVDGGTGILGSLRQKRVMELILRRIHRKSDVSVLRSMLRDGTPRSSTGDKGRGWGLPRLAERAKWNQIHNLTIISNGVYANVSRDDYRELKSSFSGTFVYWEHHEAENETE